MVWIFHKGAIDQLEKSRAHLREVEMIAGEIWVNGDSQIEREKEDLINVASENLEQLEDPNNETIYSEQQREIHQILANKKRCPEPGVEPGLK
jgi:hypothetical protein